MSNELVVPSNPQQNLELFKELAGGQKFLPRLNLAQSMSSQVGDGAVKVGHWMFIQGEDVTDVGLDFTVIPYSFRPRAMDTSGDDPINVFDAKSKEFIRIVQQSAEKDSGCFYGPEFLVYCPSMSCFASLLCGSKTARNSAKELLDLMFQNATLSSRSITKKKRTWYAPVFKRCSTPPESVPTQEELDSEVADFNNPPKEELVEDAPSQGRER